jgi:hypothetical protein
MPQQSHISPPSWQKGLDAARAAPRCHARCKHAGRRCRNAAMRGRKVCRFHGGKAGAPRGERNGAYKHGRYTIAAQIAKREAMRRFRDEMREFRALLRELDEK